MFQSGPQWFSRKPVEAGLPAVPAQRPDMTNRKCGRRWQQRETGRRELSFKRPNVDAENILEILSDSTRRGVRRYARCRWHVKQKRLCR